MRNREPLLIQILDSRGISRRWFARQVGIHESSLSRFAKGKRGFPVWFRAKAAELLHTSEDELFPGVEEVSSRKAS